jgi:uncharacterized protein YlxP (DUF503 family)
MIVGVCNIFLLIDEAFSLKEKRRIVKSITQRLKARFNASVAEVDLNDKWKNVVIGVACVSNDSKHIDSTLSNIINFVENDGRVVVVEQHTEKIHINLPII